MIIPKIPYLNIMFVYQEILPYNVKNQRHIAKGNFSFAGHLFKLFYRNPNPQIFFNMMPSIISI